MHDQELRRMFKAFAAPVAGAVEPPDARRIRARGRRRSRNLIGGTALALCVLAGGAVGARAGLVRPNPPVGQIALPATTQPSSPTTIRPQSGVTSPPTTTPATTTTLPLGRIRTLNAVQVIGPGSAVAVGDGAILATGDRGRTWTRLWSGAANLRDVDFSTATNGWVIGDGTALATTDGGQHWRPLGEPGQGTLRKVHFVSPREGWGIAGGTDLSAGPGALPVGPVQPVGATRLVHSADGGRSWSTLASPSPPQSVCFASPRDGWVASGTSVWRSTDGGRGWGAGPSFTLPVAAGGPAFQAELQCADGGAAWVRFTGGGAALGHIPYAIYATVDGGANWRGVAAEGGTLATELRLPSGPGSYPGPFSVVDASTAVMLSPTPAADSTGVAIATRGGGKLTTLPAIAGARLLEPSSASFASATTGWVVGRDRAGRAVILATADGGRHWTGQLRSSP
jgi:photosystem II stability/assembly factor-like uncharacterized protein